MLLGPLTMDVERLSLHRLFLVVSVALEWDSGVEFSSFSFHIDIFRTDVSIVRTTLSSWGRSGGL